MSYNCCSGSFSARSLGDPLLYPGSCCGSSYPSNLVYTTDCCSPSTCQQDSSLHSGCQETCCKPIRCQTSYVVSSPCQTSCYRPRTSMLCSPFQKTYARSPGSGSGRGCFLGAGSRSCYSLGFGSHGFRPLGCGVCGFPPLSHGFGFYRPTYFAPRSCQSSCYRPTCQSGFY